MARTHRRPGRPLERRRPRRRVRRRVHRPPAPGQDRLQPVHSATPTSGTRSPPPDAPPTPSAPTAPGTRSSRSFRKTTSCSRRGRPAGWRSRRDRTSAAGSGRPSASPTSPPTRYPHPGPVGRRVRTGTPRRGVQPARRRRRPRRDHNRDARTGGRSGGRARVPTGRPGRPRRPDRRRLTHGSPQVVPPRAVVCASAPDGRASRCARS